MEKRECICFAYFVDGKFIGWYADSFGSVRRQSPKIYRNSEKQIKIVHDSLSYKMREVNKSSQEEVVEAFKATTATTTDRRELKKASITAFVDYATQDSGDSLRGKQVELRIVSCPIYDGPNPDFDETAYKEACAKHRDDMKVFLKEQGIDWDSGPSSRRSDAVKIYEALRPAPKCNNWIYADYAKVKEWAANEPTEFLGTLIPELSI